MRRKKSFFKKFFGFLFLSILLGVGYYSYRNYQILKQVYQFESQVEKATADNGISEYKELAMGIIFTESKGLGNDPMQSSESAFGEPNQFDNPESSIEQGVLYLAQAIKRAESMGTDIWTAVQAYNFGLEYIDYVAERGKFNSLELAEEYSKEVLSPLLGNDEQSQYRYWGFRSITYNGGFLYHNGGNLFYADIVKFNEFKIKATNFLF